MAWLNMEMSASGVGNGVAGAATRQRSAKRKSRMPEKSIEILSGEEWLDAVVALHASAREAAPGYLLPKPPEYFRDLLAGKSGIILGVMIGEVLAGFTAMLFSPGFAEAHAAGHITFPDENRRIARAFARGKVCVMQSLCVGREWMGRSIAGDLMTGVASIAIKRGCQHVFAQVAAENVACWSKFLDKRFSIVASWESGYRRFLLRYATDREIATRLKAEKKYETHIYKKDYNQLPAILAELSSRVEAGQVVFIDPRASDAGAMHFMFAKLPQKRSGKSLSAGDKAR